MNYFIQNGILHSISEDGKVGPLPLQCPFRNMYMTPVQTSKLQSQHGQNMSMNISVCCVTCPAFELREAEKEVHLHCFDRTISLADEIKTPGTIETPSNVLPLGNT